MSLDHRKELTPVLYDESAVKILNDFRRKAGQPCFSPHWHERMEILLIVEGDMLLQVDREQARVTAGEVGLIPPTAVHHATAGDGGVVYRVLMFDVAAFLNSVRGSRRLLTAFMNGDAAFPTRVSDPAAVQAVRRILEIRAEKHFADPLLITAQVYLLFGTLFDTKAPVSLPPTVTDERFSDVLTYVDAHFKEPLTVAALCERFGYTESYFCRRFKAVTGMSPGKYICIRRLEGSKQLMEAGATGIAAIAAACGFYDSGYFARCFKQTYGMTPTRYISLLRADAHRGE